MNDNDHERRAYYLAKIDEAERLAARTSDPDALDGLAMIADGYRALLKRLHGQEPPTRH